MAPYSGGHFLDLQPQIARRVPAEGISLSYITARRFKAGVPCLLHDLGDWGAGSIGSRNGVLTVEGRINFQKYEGLQPLYGEYNIGPFRRSFRISGRVNQEGIKAEMRDGVITLVLPKAEEAKPRRIEVR